jgi:hypothetical protein
VAKHHGCSNAGATRLVWHSMYTGDFVACIGLAIVAGDLCVQIWSARASKEYEVLALHMVSDSQMSAGVDDQHPSLFVKSGSEDQPGEVRRGNAWPVHRNDSLLRAKAAG